MFTAAADQHKRCSNYRRVFPANSTRVRKPNLLEMDQLVLQQKVNCADSFSPIKLPLPQAVAPFRVLAT